MNNRSSRRLESSALPPRPLGPLSAALAVLMALSLCPGWGQAKKNRGGKKAQAEKKDTAAKDRGTEDKKDHTATLLKAAILAYGMADFESSIGKLQQAREEAKKPEVQAKIQLYLAANYFDMDKKAEAEQALKAALTHDPRMPVPTGLKSSLREFLESIRDASRGTVAVKANLKSAVWVDGKLVGETPYEAELAIGSHNISVTGPGGDKQVQAMVIYPGRRTTFKARVTGPVAKKPAKIDKKGRIWTWVVGATAVAAAGAGLGVWLWSDSQYSEWQDLRDQPAPDEARLTELEDGIRSKEIAAYALWGTAGALAATSVVLFFLEGKGKERRSAGLPARLMLSPVAGEVQGVVLRGLF